MIPQRIANFVIILVSVVFALNFAAQFFVASWQPDPYIYGIFMTIVGGSLALRRENGHGKRVEPPAKSSAGVGGDGDG